MLHRLEAQGPRPAGPAAASDQKAQLQPRELHRLNARQPTAGLERLGGGGGPHEHVGQVVEAGQERGEELAQRRRLWGAGAAQVEQVHLDAEDPKKK